MSDSNPTAARGTVILAGAPQAWCEAAHQAGWTAVACHHGPAALLRAAQQPCDAMLWFAADVQGLQPLASWPGLLQFAADAAVLAVVPALDEDAALGLVSAGLDDVITLPAAFERPARRPAQAAQAALLRALAMAVARRRMAVLQRRGGSIDLGTGLPTRLQWLDHLNQLCALREREPAPMAVLALHLQARRAAGGELDEPSRLLLQRKLAVRLRAALRASDVVGTVRPDVYAVLLAWMESPADADAVARKLVRALQAPLRVGVEPVHVVVATGVARHGDDGRDGQHLLQAALERAQGGAGGAAAGWAASRFGTAGLDAANDAGLPD